MYARYKGWSDLSWLKEEGLRREGAQGIGMLTISRGVKFDEPTQLLVLSESAVSNGTVRQVQG